MSDRNWYKNPVRDFPRFIPLSEFTLVMSHNSKYYTKKIKKKDVKGLQNIGTLFKKLNNESGIPSSTVSWTIMPHLLFLYDNDKIENDVDNLNSRQSCPQV